MRGVLKSQSTELLWSNCPYDPKKLTGLERMKLTVVIPTYNEAQNLPDLTASLFNLPIENINLLIVDDDSPDGTGLVADNLVQKYPSQLSVIHRKGKQGLGSAYLCGFTKAIEINSDLIAQMDADFSHPPEMLLTLMDALSSSDIALGSRYIQGGGIDQNWPFWRRNLSGFGNLYSRVILGLPIRDATGGLKMWKREVLAQMPLERVRSNGYAFQVEMSYIAYLLGFKFKEIPFYFVDRYLGKSKMSLKIQVEAAVRVWQMRYEYRGLKAASKS